MPHLLKFQIGPVQDFIAQARSTRDLWSGSYLLSWLVAAGIRKLQTNSGIELLFPNPKGQPMLDFEEALSQNGSQTNHEKLLTPNLPNLFIAKVETDVEKAAEECLQAIEAEWLKIAHSVWGKREKFHLPDEAKDRFFSQVKRHLSISWQATGLNEDYAGSYQQNGWHLDAVRQTRDFDAWDSSPLPTGKNRLPFGKENEKDSLSGKEEALVGGTEYKEKMANLHGPYPALFAKHADFLGAAAIIKRTWHLAYLENLGLQTSSAKFKIRSIPAIAARLATHVDDPEPSEQSENSDKYVAAITFDGDSIGKWVSGENLANKSQLESYHREFSGALSHFAIEEVRKIVEKRIESKDHKGNSIQVPLGQLIYAGGDDVVALVPSDIALECAFQIRQAFRQSTQEVKDDEGNHPDASAGIAIAHINSPLQDLIRNAQKAEKRAKNVVGRPAFSITLMKRSGEISHWGSQWNENSGGLELYQAIDEMLQNGSLSARFPHRVCELLEPYLTNRAGEYHQRDSLEKDEVTIRLMQKEFGHAAEQQGSKSLRSQLEALLSRYLDGILETRRQGSIDSSSQTSSTQELLSGVIGLSTTVAFAHRNREKPAKAQLATV